MLLLSDEDKSIEVILGGAITTNQLKVVANWRDYQTVPQQNRLPFPTQNYEFDSDTFYGSTNSGTAVEIVPAPDRDVLRKIESIFVYNYDTVATTVTVRVNDNGAYFNIVKIILQANETLIVKKNNGIMVIDANGCLKTSLVGFASNIEDAINNGVTDKAPSENAVYDALQLKENLANKSTDGTFAANSDTLYPSQKASKTYADAREVAAKAYADSLVVGLWDDRGNYDASVNAYPSAGGSGVAGAIKKGDIWTISVAGTLPTGQVVEVGDTVRALIDTPGNTQANWAIAQQNIGYTAENAANKTDVVAGNTASSTKYLSVKGYFDWLLQGLTQALSAKVTPVDADSVLIEDSADSNKTKKTTWANIKATLKTYNDTLYTAINTCIPLSYLDTDGTFAANSDAKVPSQKAAKTYMDAGLALKMQRLNPTAVKTANYNALANDFVPVDCSAGNVVITIPAAPADGTLIALKLIAVSGAFEMTFNLGGADVFNKTGGSTSGSIGLLNQVIIIQYKATGAIWYVLADDMPLSGLDARYVLVTNIATVAETNAGTSASKVPSVSGLQNSTYGAAKNVFLATNFI